MTTEGQPASHPQRQSLTDQIAIVTGGTRGIGLATVELFLKEGASVAYCGRDGSLGEQIQSRLTTEWDGRCAFFQCDVGSEDQVARLVASCKEQLGRPTILINNAGVNANFDAVEMTAEEWEQFFAVDLKATWLASKHALPHMVEAGRGAIVNVSSIHGFVSLPGFFPYGAAKAGLVGLTRNLALDYGPKGIRVNVVCPGFTRTRLVQESIDLADDREAAEVKMVAGVALGRIGSPEEVAQVIRFLASEEASYVTGASLLVDGGLTARRAG
jgi:NAD(P)-dependent dehydrogenase (short-subunit alcohol dehydrogenase family)